MGSDQASVAAIHVESAEVSEEERLAALAHYDVLDTPSEEAFDRVTRLAARIFDVPMALVSLIDGHRQWFKSRRGVHLQETPKGDAFCCVTIREGAPLVICDASADPRFAQNPYVVDEPHVRFYAGAPLRTPEGHAIGTLCVMDREPRSFDEEQVAILGDLAQIVMEGLELRLLANTDALTGALSRRAFREEATRALHLAARHRNEISLINLDLDRFKSVNDTYGHAVGDAVLARSVRACLGQLRKSDVIGRLGGEEFAVLLPQTGPRAALDVAERLRLAIAAERHATPEGELTVTASLGVVSAEAGATDVAPLLREADAAVYRAKAEGRDRCVMGRSATREKPGRRRVFKGGRILFNKGASTIDCTVRALSPTGAGLDVSTVVGLPERFDLAIEADQIIRPCRIVEMKDRHVEVEFA